MTQKQFNALSLDDRATYLWDSGMFVETVQDDGYLVKLYSLHEYFVEVYYSLSSDKIEKIEVAGELEMKKYVEGIDFYWLKK